MSYCINVMDHEGIHLDKVKLATLRFVKQCHEIFRCLRRRAGQCNDLFRSSPDMNVPSGRPTSVDAPKVL